MNLSGPLPPALSSLRSLNLSNNLFNGPFPSSYAHLKYLRVLDFYNNNLTSLLPVAAIALPNLRHLHLGGNLFNRAIPLDYGCWTCLEYLTVSGNSLGDAIPSELGNLTSLRELFSGYFNSFDGGVLPELGRLKNLVRLEL